MKLGGELFYYFNDARGVCKASLFDKPAIDNDCCSNFLLALPEFTGRLEIGAIVTGK